MAANVPPARRMTTGQRASVVLGSGAFVFDTTLSQIFIGDGVTDGGVSVSVAAAGVTGTLSSANMPATVVQTTGSYARPSWLVSVAGSIVSGDIAGNAASINGTVPSSKVTGLAASATVDTTNASNIASGTIGASYLPATVVQTTGSYANPAWITSVAGSIIAGNISGNAAGITGAPSGILKGVAGSLASATAGTDYLAPGGSGASLTGITAGQVGGLAASATTDTTNASNIASGTLNASRLPGAAVQAITLNTSGLIHATPTTATVSGGTAALNQTLVAQTANTILAGPSSGSAAAPTWRALVAADIPSLSATYATAGANGNITSLAGLTTPLSVAQGGTGANSAAGALLNLSPTVTQDSTQTQFAVVLNASQLQADTADIGTDLNLSNLVTAFKFTSSGALNPRGILLQLKAVGTVNNPTAGVKAEIYTDSSGVPGSLVGSVSNYLLYGSIGSTYNSIELPLQGNPALTPTLYWIVITQSQAPSGFTLYLNTGATNNTQVATGAAVGSLTATAGPGCYYRLYGRTGTALYGYSESASGVVGASMNFYGVQGTSTNSIGVYGASTNYYGIEGISANNYGVYAGSTNSIGVRASSTNSYGVYASSVAGIGVYGSSTNSIGIEGVAVSNTGVYGASTSGAGVVGQSSSSYGVQGYSLAGHGVLAQLTGTLTGNTSGRCLWAYKSLTLGAYDATGPVIRTEDSTASSGKLIDGIKQGTTVFSLYGSGAITCGAGSLATSATDGDFYISTCSGTPTGVPATRTGYVAMRFDATNNKLWIYNGAWKGVVVS